MPDRDQPAAASPATIPTTITTELPMTYPVPAIRHDADGKGVRITPNGLHIICEHLKLALPPHIEAMRDLPAYEHRQARGHLRNLLDLIDTVEFVRELR
ncbi:MAG: hypothetical protein JWL96_2599 [Sphingomonas bacterium]|nr:hypothetical protein [Sphingomonas bacterium]